MKELKKGEQPCIVCGTEYSPQWHKGKYCNKCYNELLKENTTKTPCVNGCGRTKSKQWHLKVKKTPEKGYLCQKCFNSIDAKSIKKRDKPCAGGCGRTESIKWYNKPGSDTEKICRVCFDELLKYNKTHSLCETGDCDTVLSKKWYKGSKKGKYICYDCYQKTPRYKPGGCVGEGCKETHSIRWKKTEKGWLCQKCASKLLLKKDIPCASPECNNTESKKWFNTENGQICSSCHDKLLKPHPEGGKCALDCNRTESKRWYNHPSGKICDSCYSSLFKYSGVPCSTPKCGRTKSKKWATHPETGARICSKCIEEYRYKNDPQFKLRKVLRARLNAYIKTTKDTKKELAISAISDLGCDVNKLRSHLESLFQEGMEWGNHSTGYDKNGNKRTDFDRFWHIDHIKPLSSFDLTDAEQAKEACHYTNLQPLWADENMAKSDKLN